MKRPHFAERHPYWFTAILELGVILVYLVAGTAAHVLKLSELELYGYANLGLTLIAAALLTGMGWWKTAGFKSPARKRDLLWFLVPFLPMVVNFIPDLEPKSLRQMLVLLSVTLMVGFSEEAIFRGLMLRALQPRGLWKAAIITSLLFGLTHALNVLAGKSLAEGAVQVFYAVAIGFAYAALVLHKGLIWPLVVAHFAIDFVGFLEKPGFGYTPFWTITIAGGMAIVFTAYGLFVMRQETRRSRALDQPTS